MLRKYLCKPIVLRVILILLNIIFIIVGITIILLGVYIKIDGNISAVLDKFSSVSTFEGQSLSYIAFVMIGGGIITILIAFTGCLGSLWQSRIILNIYSSLLILLMLLELTGFIMVFVYKNRLETVYKKELYTVFSKALNESNTKVLDAFTELEKRLKCCGVNGIDDYHGREPQNPECYRYREGCSDVIIKLFNNNLPIIATALGLVLLFELLCLINAIIYSIALKNYHGDIYLGSRRTTSINMKSFERSKYNKL